MLNELTSLKLQAAALELEILQRLTDGEGESLSPDLTSMFEVEITPPEGPAPLPGHVSLAEYARRAGVSKSTVKKVFRNSLRKCAARILADPTLPPDLARDLSRRATRLLTERGL